MLYYNFASELCQRNSPEVKGFVIIWFRLFREKSGMDQKSDNEWKNDLSNDTMRQDPNDPEEGNENE